MSRQSLSHHPLNPWHCAALVWLLGALGLALLLAAPSARAMETGEASRGTLLLQGEDGQRHPAPTLDTDVQMQVTAMLARVTVRQTFRNPGDRWAEGIYVFPLPENAAVDHMRMKVGERVIEGQIRERQAARKQYEQAKQTGRRAALVEQRRPNIFTTAVANIAPHGEVTVVIQYQQAVSWRDGRFSLRFPTVVEPRYIPGTPIREKVQLGTQGWARDTDQVPDASRITPPVRKPEQGPINPVHIHVDLAPGFPLASLASPYHRITTHESADDHYTIDLASGQVPADRDFVLQWTPLPGKAPKAALFTQHGGDGDYALLLLMPPGKETLAKQAGYRDVTFVIDTSGSMGGTSIHQAKAALQLGLDGLKPTDRFNVIEFNSNTRSLFPAVVDATPGNLARAKAWVDSLDANGGTEMLAALNAALGGQRDGRRLRQVVFLTDGAVGNEDALFRVIKQRLGDARLFTVGIGSAPNGHFMTKAAEYGHGSYTYIGSSNEVLARMGELLKKLEYPALTHIRVELPGDAKAEIYPRPLPDLYLDEPLQLVLRADQLPSRLLVRGEFGNRPWQVEVGLGTKGDRPGVAVQWARARIASLMDRYREAGDQARRMTARDAVLKTALAHHLVSRFTSLVAVDKTPARPAGQPLDSHALETNLPAGMQYKKVFGMARTATPAELELLLGALALLAAALLARRSRGAA